MESGLTEQAVMGEKSQTHSHGTACHQSTLEQRNGRVQVKTLTIPAGTQSKISDHLFQGQMPKRIVLGFVENASFNGDNLKNPFHFKNESVKKLEVSINGETISTRPYEPKFQGCLYLRSQFSLYKNGTQHS